METRQRVLEAATRLFNEQGTAAVSTNHIAAAAGISPGNLYYHFHNKDEIIRAIFDQLIPVWREVCSLPQGRAPEFGDLLSIVRGNFTVVWSYRFYYRELAVMMRRDPLLAEKYRQMRQEGLGGVEMLILGFAAAGVLELPPEPDAAAKLAQICWILADFWLPFVELGGEVPGPEQVRQGEELILLTLQPYLTAKALGAMSIADREPAT